MRYRKIGNSDLEVSVVALGTWVFGGNWWGGSDDNDSADTVRKAVDMGINFIDTAPIYGAGRSESVIGKAIKGIRDKVIIATKCGVEYKGSKVKANLSAAFIREEIENSLTRLGTDSIDLYQCHWPDNVTPYDETFGELKKLAAEGKIRYAGVSNFSKAEMERALKIMPIISNQVQYSILERYIEKDILPLCLNGGLSVLAYGPMGGGILTGKYKEAPAFSDKDARDSFYRFYKEPVFGKTKNIVSLLGDISKKHGANPQEAAINWCLSNPLIASALVGCRTPAHASENARAGTWELTKEELASINSFREKIFDE